MTQSNLPAIIGPGNTYIPLLAVQQRPHSLVYQMPVREHGSAAEATAASLAARARLRNTRSPTDRPVPVRIVRQPRDMLNVTFAEPIEIPMTESQRIIRDVCVKHGVSYPEIIGPRRGRPIIAARHEAMYRLSKETTLSLPAIGRRMGGKDHTTVIHAIRKFEALLRGETYVQTRYGKAKLEGAQ
jgi:chromosomal replication initiation ATPase DnaA